MGRRAKNKQAAPQSLAPANDASDRPSAKKLGKRKADADIDAKESLSKRPAKKARENDERLQKAANGKAKTQAVEKGEKLSKSNRRKNQEDEDEDDASSGSSEGWEGVSDDEDLKTKAKYVLQDVLLRYPESLIYHVFYRLLFHDSDDQEALVGDLDDLDMDGEDGDE